MDLPAWLVALAVLPPFAIFVWYLVRAAKVSRYQAVALFAAFAYGMSVEALALHTTHDYDYANLWLMFGRRPDWVPVTIGICWASILYVVMRTSDALGLPWWQRPFYDGATAMTLDLVIDPVMSSTRAVANTLLPCMDETGPLRGGLSLWTWCEPTGATVAYWFSVPVSNFLGWFIVITTLSCTVRLGERYFRGAERPLHGQVVLLLLMAAFAIGLDAGVAKIFGITGSGLTAEYTALAIAVALPFAMVLLQRRTVRLDNPFSPGLLAWPVYAYLTWGSLYYVERIGAAAWPGEAVLMAATIATGMLMLLLPYLGRLRRSRPA